MYEISSEKYFVYGISIIDEDIIITAGGGKRQGDTIST